MDQRAGQSADIDVTFYDAQPPRMVDARHFPPEESARGDFGRVDMTLGDVKDPLFPWQDMSHDSEGGKKRRDAVKKAQEEAVLKYVLVHTKYWQQFRPPEFLPGKREETVSYTVGHERRQSTTVEEGLEISLGLKAKAFSAGAKASIKWTQQVQESFSDSHTKTVTQELEGNRWYFYWQTVDDLTLYRVLKSEPKVLEEVQRVAAPSGVVMLDSFTMPKRAEPQGPRLGAAAVKLRKGESANFPGWVAAKTRVYAKNLNDNDDGEATISWMGLGGRIVMALGPDSTEKVDRWLPASFKVTSSGVTEIEVWTA